METADITQNAETAAYGTKLLDYRFAGRDIYVISDLHIAAGLQSDGNYTGDENFFADRSFGRFIDHLISNNTSTAALLIINGDLIDFLRICNIPEKQQDFEKWSALLAKIGISKNIDELSRCIDKRERKFGLKTDDYKSVWKLYLSANGHPEVFDSLAKWLASGHKLVITKGNHDLEWYWPAVRSFMNLLMAEKIAAAKTNTVAAALNGIVLPNLLFVDDNMVINNRIYIEHGHRYENFTTVDGPAVLKNETELNLPFGSFFNRYLVNRIELAYPYIDDVRPRENILSILIQERFPLAIKMLFYYVPLVLRVIPKQQYKYALRYLFQFLLIIAIPLAITVFVILKFVYPVIKSPNANIWTDVFSAVKGILPLILSYFLGRLFAMLQLSPPGSLFKNAEAVFYKLPHIQVATFGHTHDPEQKDTQLKKNRYYNTGTWIPVYETDAADIRLDKTYTFLHLQTTAASDVPTTCLMRWNDDALRIDELILMDRK